MGMKLGGKAKQIESLKEALHETENENVRLRIELEACRKSLEELREFHSREREASHRQLLAVLEQQARSSGSSFSAMDAMKRKLELAEAEGPSDDEEVGPNEALSAEEALTQSGFLTRLHELYGDAWSPPQPSNQHDKTE